MPEINRTQIPIRKPPPECYFCHAPVPEAEYCPGCNNYVCACCKSDNEDEPVDPILPHNVTDHIEEMQE